MTTALLIAAPFVVAPVTFVLGVVFGRAIDRVDAELAPPYDELFPPPASGPWGALPDRFPPLSGPPRELQLDPFQLPPIEVPEGLVYSPLAGFGCTGCGQTSYLASAIKHDGFCPVLARKTAPLPVPVALGYRDAGILVECETCGNRASNPTTVEHERWCAHSPYYRLPS